MTSKQKAARERFKKVQAEAKKLRAKNPKLTQAQAVKQAWAILYKTGKVGEKHTDTKSHNVNIRVVSGTKNKKDRWSDYIKYKNKIITKLFPSGMYEIYDDKNARFVKFDDLDDVKFYIDNMQKNLSGWRKGGTAIIEHNEKPLKKFKNVRVTRIAKNNLFEKPGTFKKFRTLAGLFDTSIISDIDSLKKEFYKLAKIYHPDRGGTTAQMQQLNEEYENLLNKLLQGSNLTEDQKNNEIKLDEALRNVIDQLIGLEGLDVEIIGKWIWVTGNTYPVREVFKKVGMFPLKKDNKFYWVYKGVESKGRGDLTLEQIKNKYGAQKVEIPKIKKITGYFRINKTKLLNNLKKLTKALDYRPV